MSTPCEHRDIARQYLGVDLTEGRFADVTVERCSQCGQLWLHYQFEFEAFTASGRWYRGLISAAQAATLTAENAAGVLESLPSYTAGGSYFRGDVHQRSGPLA